MSDVALPEWATHALNGNSTRVPRHWNIDALEPGDLLAGKVVQIGRCTLDIQVEAGSVGGEPLEPGEWRRVMLSGIGILRAWVKRDEPAIADNVVIQYRGRVGAGSRPRLDFVCGVSRPAPWEG